MRIMVASFSIGLMTAALIMGGVFMLEDQENSSEGEQKNKLDGESAQSYLEERDYEVIDPDEVSTLKEKNEQLHKKITQLKETMESMQESNEEEESSAGGSSNTNTDSSVTQYTLTISSGMTPNDIARELEQQDIIQDGDEFSKFLESNDYSRIIQLGTYEVASNLEYSEIAQRITGN
ncbi:hypothetical protein CEY16_04370 [Halalkalibacillus sediminis]|uniref:Aminodeoxychorismate lyase n=1 Tax=Halalkalibacillus sediminis TaxID=2018042 RepID=A0A2I0QXF2_9BACI|nr:hypothetical protein [Halalkalibacillus sediminis]PKR78994.1 hypothetical protein CEY16_04370 [Halalkalibacillus sediminis]